MDSCTWFMLHKKCLDEFHTKMAKALFKIFDSAHAQPEFFRAVTVIPDVLLFGI